MKVIWCITGAGHHLRQTVSQMVQLAVDNEITVAYSAAGIEVAQAYDVEDAIGKLASEVVLESVQGASTPISASTRFDRVIVAPCTANTCAKIVSGIADSMVTNIVSQSLKRGTDVVILPTDYCELVESDMPSGRKIKVAPRRTDLENFERLKLVKGVQVVTDPEKLTLS